MNSLEVPAIEPQCWSCGSFLASTQTTGEYTCSDPECRVTKWLGCTDHATLNAMVRSSDQSYTPIEAYEDGLELVRYPKLDCDSARFHYPTMTIVLRKGTTIVTVYDATRINIKIKRAVVHTILKRTGDTQLVAEFASKAGIGTRAFSRIKSELLELYNDEQTQTQARADD